jgi:uncharacterized membrane protein YphA (DoxX/SURF4 family)
MLLLGCRSLLVGLAPRGAKFFLYILLIYYQIVFNISHFKFGQVNDIQKLGEFVVYLAHPVSHVILALPFDLCHSDCCLAH